MSTCITGGTPTQTSKEELSATRADSQATTHTTVQPASRRTAYRKASLREQKKARARKLILDSAQQLINSEGYSETKMRDVAAAANMSYQTLYNYFPTKGLILQELLTRDLVTLRRTTFETLHGADTLITKLREFAKGYVDAIAPDERHLWKEVCAELLKVTSHHSCFVALLDEHALRKCRDLLSSAQANGELDPHIDSDTLAGVVYSLLDATLIRYLVNETLSRPTILSAISAQINLTVTPYLRKKTGTAL